MVSRLPNEMLLEIFEFAGIHSYKMTRTSHVFRSIMLEILEILELTGVVLPITPNRFTKIIIGMEPRRLLSIWGKTETTIAKELLLLDAIRVGDRRGVELLIRRGVDLDYKNTGTQTFPVKCAVSFNRPECLKIILNYTPLSPFPPVSGSILVEDMFTHTSDVRFQIPVHEDIPPMILGEYIKRGQLEIFTRRRWMNDGRIFNWFRTAAQTVPTATTILNATRMICNHCLERTGSPVFCKGWIRCPTCADIPCPPLKLTPRVTIYNEDGVYTPVNETIIDVDSESDFETM